MAPSTEILSIVAVDSDLVLMGSNRGSVLVYDGNDRKLKHCLECAGDSVLALIYFKYVQPYRHIRQCYIPVLVTVWVCCVM